MYYDLDYEGRNFSQQIIKITEVGVEHILQNCSQLADFIISYTTMPDLDFDISKFHFELTNLRFSEMYIPTPALDLNGNQQEVMVDFEGANAVLSFEFKMQQQIYPYLSESGTGKIGINNLNVAIQAHFYPSTECPGRIQMKIDNFYLLASGFTIDLQSQNAWLYQGLLQMMCSIVTEVFNNQMTPYFQEFIEENGNYGFNCRDPIYEALHGTPTIAIDQRILGIDIYSQYVDLLNVGTFCYAIDLNDYDESKQGKVCTGHIMELEESYYMNIDKPTNEDMQFYFGKEVIASMFQYFVQNDTISEFIEECDQPLIVNTGVIANCSDKNGVKIEYHFVANSQYKSDDSAHFLVFLSLDQPDQYQYSQQIDDTLYYLSTGADLSIHYPFKGCWPLYNYNQYVDINCET